MKRIITTTDGKFIGKVIDAEKSPVVIGDFIFFWEQSRAINKTTVLLSSSNYSITAGAK